MSVIILFVAPVLFSLMSRLPIELRVRIYVPEPERFLLPDEEVEFAERSIRIHSLDGPWPVQYLNWLCLLVTGDWPYSAHWQQPMQTGVLQRGPTTSELLLASTLSCTALSLVLGNVAAWCRDIIPDHLMRASTCLGCGVPSFVLGLILTSVSYA